MNKQTSYYLQLSHTDGLTISIHCSSSLVVTFIFSFISVISFSYFSWRVFNLQTSCCNSAFSLSNLSFSIPSCSSWRLVESLSSAFSFSNLAALILSSPTSARAYTNYCHGSGGIQIHIYTLWSSCFVLFNCYEKEIIIMHTLPVG